MTKSEWKKTTKDFVWKWLETMEIAQMPNH